QPQRRAVPPGHDRAGAAVPRRPQGQTVAGRRSRGTGRALPASVHRRGGVAGAERRADPRRGRRTGGPGHHEAVRLRHPGAGACE
nr:hypothetical protein [Tanacetum cinerariifolium]